MRKNGFLRKVLSNLSWAFCAQAVSMLISMVFTLFIPRLLGVEGFGYWQLIVFYGNYLGVFYLGINDGIYLRMGGKKMEELDKPLLSAEIRLGFVFHCICAVVLGAISLFAIRDGNRLFVLLATVIYLPFFNLKGILGQLLQAVNRAKAHSAATIADKVTILLAVLIAFALHIRDYRYFVIAYVVGGIIAVGYLIIQAREIVFSKCGWGRTVKPDLLYNFKVGMPLMLSSLSAMLIVGSSRQIIDVRWGIGYFSTISLAISMMNLVLVFLHQSSLVLFPAIRRINAASQTELYLVVNSLMNRLLPVLLVCYAPVGTLIIQWLPNYADSILYMGILLPICLFDGKMNLVNNTYFKVLHLEKELLLVNILTFTVNTILSVVGAYVFHSIDFIAFGLVASIAMRNIISEVFISRKTGMKNDAGLHVLVAFSLMFLVLNRFLAIWPAFFLYLCVYLIYALIARGKMRKSYFRLKEIAIAIDRTESM